MRGGGRGGRGERERDKEGGKYRERGERERFKDAMLPTLKTEEGATS